MKGRLGKVAAALVIAVVLMGCGGGVSTGSEGAVHDAKSALDAVVRYLEEQYGQEGPPSKARWREERTGALVDKSTVGFVADTEAGERARVPTPLGITFHLADGTAQSFGYLAGNGKLGILRGEQSFLGGQDAAPPAGLVAVMEELLGDAAK